MENIPKKENLSVVRISSAHDAELLVAGLGHGDAVALPSQARLSLPLLVNGTAKYVLTYDAFRGLGMGHCQAQYVMLDAMEGRDLLGRLGIAKPVHSISKQSAVLGAKARRVNAALATLKEIHEAHEANCAEIKRLGLWEWYVLLASAEPPLLKMPPLSVDREAFLSILAAWEEDPSKAGLITEWKSMLDACPKAMPVNLYPTDSTGRFTTRKPNLQGLPRELRRAFPSDEGRLFISCDYHAMQPRLVAGASEDGEVLRIFSEGRDYYRVWGSILFGVSEDEVSQGQRSVMKRFSLAWLYGMGQANLVQNFAGEEGLDASMIASGLRVFQRRFSKLNAWKEAISQKAGLCGRIRSRMGRPVSLARRDAYKAACYYAQASEAEIMLKAIIALDKRFAEELPEARLRLWIHDEIVCDAPEADAERASYLMEEVMDAAFSQALPDSPRNGLLGVSIGRTWGEVK